MANQPDINKKQIQLRLSIETYHKLLRLAGGDKSRVQTVIRQILVAHVEDVELTLEEREAILLEIKQNAAKREKS
ncbi:MAG: hypothetical protein IJV69_04055 [Kiritimatiellae bacterium]|nr:hypothetical protein [Kiritimatiellia bacterium]